MKYFNLNKPFLDLKKLEDSYGSNKNFINKQFSDLVVIGMGGSTQGARAISNFANEDKIIYFDHLSSPHVFNALHKLNLPKTAFLFISKSGKTSETLTIFDFLCDYCDEKLLLKENFFVITDENASPLEDLAHHKQIPVLHCNSKIGGRFSIFELNSLIPSFYFNNQGVKNLFEGAHFALTNIDKLSERAEKIKFVINSGKIVNLNLVYGNHLLEIANWKKQLYAESLGKNGNGFMPITSEMPREQHSLLQLMMDGPKNIFYDMFSSNSIKPNLINITLNNHKNATYECLLKEKFDIEETIIDEDDFYRLGQFFVEQMIIVMKLADLIKVDPFTQDAVEKQKNFLS